MISVTGDIHGELQRFRKKDFTEQKNMTKEDYMIILGDFGVIWDEKESREEKYCLDILENKAFTTLFIDGNHENHDRLDSFPVMEWHGGKVHEIRPGVLHLMRGQLFTIEEKTFFSFGGAPSHDITGCAGKEELKRDYTAGILRRDDPLFAQKKKQCQKQGLVFRIEGENWWRREMPSEQEMEEGIATLEKADWNVDYVLTHDAPASTLFELVGIEFPPNPLMKYLDGIKQKLTYQKWFFGHYHDDRKVTEKDILMYYGMLKI